MMIKGVSKKRLICAWTWGNPLALRFFDGAGDTTPAWHAEFPSLANNPEASKKMSKYLTADAAMAGAVDAQEKIGRPYSLPDDHSKLTDEQKTEIMANVATMRGKPDTPDGYEVKVPEGAIIDDQAMADFKALAHAKGFNSKDVQDMLDFQLAFVDRVNKTTNETIGNRIKTGFDQYAKEVGGEATAALHMEWVKRYLKSKATVADDSGKNVFDEQMWKDFEERNFYNNQGKEIILLRALLPAAQQFEATGGGPDGTGSVQAAHKGALAYSEMDK